MSTEVYRQQSSSRQERKEERKGERNFNNWTERSLGYSKMVPKTLLLVVLAAKSTAFLHTPQRTRAISSSLLHNSPNDRQHEQSGAQKAQERIMESASLAGAEEISKLDIHERTKRAMLAEAVEDRIFEMVDELEALTKANGGVENLSDEVRGEAVELAKQVKASQIQYDDLVNGRPSSLLELGK
ncbi:hypothetical protein THAOC_03306 [Thalassiosira oceanica]|uniref:Uncharacterized protein n=1 Tax=Thalassiosira oceanica TaxID=159749 RepID=K0TBV7_THAOC|nr:hypothetical protein THAOC_03306 [Thalassiosira oceanica]|eukprot:EJK74985.1 hypothetical protein THAOC_03306 [Thalassiosira oceanica]